MKRFQGFLSQLMSVNESRKSIVVLILVIVTGFGLYVAIGTKDIPNNISTIILTLCGFIWGLNTVKGITDAVLKKRENRGSQESLMGYQGNDSVEYLINQQMKESNIDNRDISDLSENVLENDKREDGNPIV